MRKLNILEKTRLKNRGFSANIVVNATSLTPRTTPRLQGNFAKNHSSELTIGTILAIMLFMAIICYYVWQLRSPRYRRRFGRSSGSHRRSIARRSESLRSQRSIMLESFERSSALPRYESVVFLNTEPPPYEFPPSYEEVMSGQVAGTVPQNPAGLSNSWNIHYETLSYCKNLQNWLKKFKSVNDQRIFLRIVKITDLK